MNTIREIEKINEEELKRGIAGTSASWHSQYEKAPWVYIGNLDHSLSEGDVICVMSQFGEVEDFHLVREEDTGKSRGFGFVKYEDSRSCILAVDNFAGVKLCGRPMRVDHVEKYRLPKNLQEKEDEQEGKEKDFGPGHAYKGRELKNKYSLDKGRDLFAPPTSDDDESTKGSNSSDDDINNNKTGRKTTKSSSSKDNKEAKQKRKEERARKRKEKEERRKQREEKRQKKEDKKRKKRAHRMRDDDDDKDDDDDRRKERHERKKSRNG